MTTQTNDYTPCHPWYYLTGGAPLHPDNIEPGTCDYTFATKKGNLDEQITHAEEHLKADIERYMDIVTRGVDALSHFDRTIPFGNDEQLALATALALKHNHICYYKGLLRALESSCSEQLALF